MDTVIELAKHAQAIGADYIVVHAPVLHFLQRAGRDAATSTTETISEQVDIGIAMWSHPDSGYLMSPELCARIAELPNIVAIKYSVPREMYVRADAACRRQADRQHRVRGGVVRQHRRARLAALSLLVAALPVYQTKVDRRMRDYTDLAFKGEVATRQGDPRQPQPGARGVPAHAAGREIPRAFEILAGAARPGRRPVRPPMLELTDAEKEATRRAFETLRAEAAGSVRSSAA